MVLGVQRTGTIVAAGALQRADLIPYKRGEVTIADRCDLENGSWNAIALPRSSSIACWEGRPDMRSDLAEERTLKIYCPNVRATTCGAGTGDKIRPKRSARYRTQIDLHQDGSHIRDISSY